MEYILPLFSSFIFSFLAIQMVKPLAIKVGLVDIPKGRKKHDGHIPLIGGVAIYFGVLISSLLFLELNKEFGIFIICASLILFLGVLDDRYDLSVRIRVIAQIIVALIMVHGANLYLKTFGSIFGFFEVQLGVMGIVVTIVAVIGAINAFNMVDGIDGLAGGLSLVSFISLGILLQLSGSDWFFLPILFSAAILAFLMFNLRWPRRSLNKIFMGDAGSMLIGFTIVWLLVIGTSEQVQAFRPVTALYIIALPLMDMVAIMYRRIKKGASPFKPDREHLHHIFERAGYSRKQALAYITFLAAILSLLGCTMEIINVPDWVMFAVFVIMFSAYSYALAHIWRILSWIRSH